MKSDTTHTDLILGRHLLIRDLTGRGPFETRLAHDGEDCIIIKTFKKNLLVTADLKAGIRESIRDWERLGRHPHTVAIKNSGEHGGDPFIAVEYVAAGAGAYSSLEKAFSGGGPGPAKALRWLIQLARALEHSWEGRPEALHAPTPRSVLIGADNRVKLSNFGGLRFAGLLRSHEFIPPSHLAPEQHDDIARYDARSAVYLYGILLHQAVKGGEAPFTAPPPRDGSPGEARRYMDELLRKKKNRNYHSFLRGEGGAPLIRMIERCLDPNPCGRYGGFGELADEIEMATQRYGGESADAPPVPEEYWDLFNRGAAFFERGMHGEAAECFDEIISNIDHPFAWLHLGLALDALGVPDDAIECLKKAAEINPSSPDIWRHLGTLLHNGAYDRDALACLEKAARLDPEDPLVRVTMGRLYLRQRQYGRALSCFDAPPSFAKNDEQAWHDRGFALEQLGYHGRALGCYEKALSLKPEDPDLQERRAVCLDGVGHHDEAADAFAGIATQKKASPLFWAAYGDALHGAGKLDDAIACYDRALGLAPSDASLLHKKGRALLDHRSYRDAADAFDRVLEADPSDTYALNAKGMCLYNDGDSREALTCFDAALVSTPGDPMLLKHRSGCLVKLKRFTEAVESIEKALAADPTDPLIEKIHAMALQEWGRYDRAAVSYCAYLARAPRDADAWLNGGSCLYNMGLKEGALEFFRACIILDPGAKQALLLKAKAEEELARKDLAVSSYIHYLAVSNDRNDESTSSARKSLESLSRDLSPGARFARTIGHEEARRACRSRVLPVHILIGTAETVARGGVDHELSDPEIAEIVDGERIELKQIMAAHGIEPSRFAAKLRDLAGRGNTPYPGTVHPSEETKKAIGQARLISGGGPVGLTHLFAALLESPDPAIQKALARDGIDAAGAVKSVTAPDREDGPDRLLMDAVKQARSMELELTQFMATFLELKIGPGWEEKVAKHFSEASKRKAVKNSQDCYVSINYNILDAATLGEKGEIIRHGSFWNLFREVFIPPGKKDAFAKQFIEGRFSGMNLLHAILSHPQPYQESTVRTGIGAFTEIIDMIRLYSHR